MSEEDNSRRKVVAATVILRFDRRKPSFTVCFSLSLSDWDQAALMTRMPFLYVEETQRKQGPLKVILQALLTFAVLGFCALMVLR